ncbi:MAG: MotA/TolQ/ExbB proton channel family protein [Polyangiaceae bacterium]|nr:MotA/TolQ/ExbB proton channel family protein [Polyangiaceae bacterium]MBK8999902.1 MotA/TolQ/ExbB proton channel family protein [Myxococcales bacterium]MCE7891591.1 MotA/TolQ/ExbB proton channel family protein [Sorangiineae bacterium PRO1]MCL4749612.1 MotA/TolQ/ExbB proton channel family protein [Myxococcales bacterium]
MNLVSWLQRLMTNFGAGWVMWLLVVLSVLSVAVMLERAWFYWSLRDDLAKLAHDLRERLRANDLDGAKKRMESSPSAEAAVVSAGLLEADRGATAAEQAMQGAQALQRIKLERRLAFLGTLGNNAPFIGLFGTVIGVVQAFEALSRQNVTAQTTGAMAPQEVMYAIAEALVATAVGLAVAIPAVVMFNVFQRHSKAILANTDALTRVLLSHLSAVEAGFAPAIATRRSDPPARGKDKSQSRDSDEE